MVKYIQTVHQILPADCLSEFDRFVGLELKGLIPAELENDIKSSFKMKQKNTWKIKHQSRIIQLLIFI